MKRQRGFERTTSRSYRCSLIHHHGNRLNSQVTEGSETIPLSEKIQGFDYIAYLLRLGQLLCTLTEKHTEFLCQEIQTLTQQRASLHLQEQAPVPAGTFSLLPLQFQGFRYGYLAIATDEADPKRPALPLFAAQMMAEGVSYILHLLEQHLFLQSLGPKWQAWETVKLTAREQEVLILICQGYSSEKMAQLLHISLGTLHTHRQHIYEQLGVHTEYDARIAAYHLRLFSFLKV